MVQNPGTGFAGGAGTGLPPAAGTAALPMAGAGMMMGRAGVGAAGVGVAGVGAAGVGTAGTMAPDMPEAGTGASGTGAAGMGAAGMAAAGTGASGTGAAGGGSEMSCLDGITDFKSEGPFDYMPAHEGAVKIWVPMVPAGCKVPIVHLANGTGATCSAYQNVLNRLASHGFLTTCYENTNTGAGTQGVMAIETVIQNHGEMAAKAIGSTGHSQGGQAAFTVLALAEEKWGTEYTYAGLAMEPASGFGTQPAGGWPNVYAKIKSPMIAFSGTADVLVSRGWVQQGFDALTDTIEAYHWSAAGATHIPTPQAETMELSIPWFRWKLLGDNEACKAFKALDGGGRWTTVDEQNPKSCM